MQLPARLPALLLLVPAFCLSPAAPARAQSGANCLHECQGVFCNDYGNTTDLCLKVRAACEARCGEGRRWWGAIAYSTKDKAFGWSVDWNDVDEAKNYAMRKCAAAQGQVCKVWAVFENACGAVAADSAIVGWGTAGDKNSAHRRALDECRKAGGKKCTVEAWACSTMW